MEVHTHTHSARKKWTHYLWEFLMLFLAVFCGFTAENIREHNVEKKRAKQYILSLYEDLKNDTVRINSVLKYDDDKIAALNTMMACHDSVSKNPKATSCMGLLLAYSKSNRAFPITDRTLRQLANAGGYRILDKADADSILGYENMYKRYLDFQSTVFQTAQDNVRNTLNLMADFKVNAPLQGSTQVNDAPVTELSGPLLFTNDMVLLNRWFNELLLYLRVTNSQRISLMQLKEKAINLIQYYKSKHHFD